MHVNVLDTKSLNVIAANARIVKEKNPNTQVKHCFCKTLCFCALVSLSSNALANSACDANDSLTIYSATDDSFTDGGRDDGADEADTGWWTTTNISALEIAENSLGLVSGGSGRGLRTTFSPQTLAEGQTLQAVFTFTTPTTIGEDRDSAFRIGLYDKLGRAELEGDLSASSKKPNKSYDGLPGYMIDFDINLKDAGSANIDIRKHKDDQQGRLLGTTKGYSRLAGGGDAYQFAAQKTYTGVMAVQKVSNGVEISGSLSHAGKVLSEFSFVDEGSDTNNFGMLAFHVNSKTFGTSKKKDTSDNGLDFKNVKVEVLP